MASTLNDTSIQVLLKSLVRESVDLGAREAELRLSRGFNPANGTLNGQADKLFWDKDNIAASGTKDWDLAGTLIDVFGVALTFVEVVGILVAAYETNTNDVVVGNHPTAAFVGPFGAAAHTMKIPPGNFWVVTNKNAGWPVTATTADLLRITNGGAGTAVDYDIAILGRSA